MLPRVIGAILLLSIVGLEPKTLQGQAPKADEKKALTKVTAGGIDFELTNSKMNGPNWELLVNVVCPEANAELLVLEAKAYTPEGKLYTSSFRTLVRGKINAKLPLGQKVQIKVNMGPLPEQVKHLTTVQLECQTKKLKGNYFVTFKEVAVQR